MSRSDHGGGRSSDVRHSDGGVGRGGRVTSKDDDVRQRGALGPKMTAEKLQMQGGRRGRTRDAATGGDDDGDEGGDDDNALRIGE